MELECAKVRGDLLSYKMDYHKSCTKYSDMINDLNQTISKMKDKLSAHQETISILSQWKEAQIKLYKTREDKELEKVIELENKVKVLDNIVFAKPEFLKKAQRASPRLYDIGCYNDNLSLMLALDSDKVIRLEKESRSKLSDLIRLFDYDKLNNLYDFFVPQREKSSKQRYFSERSRLSHTNVNNGKSKESFHKQTTLLEKRMDESIQLYKQCQSSIEIFKVKSYVNTIITGDLKAQLQDKCIVISELKKLIEKLKGKSVDTKFEKSSVIRQPNAFKSESPIVLGKLTTFLNSFVRKDFSKSTSITQTHVSNDFSKPVTAQTLPSNKKSILKNTNVLAPGMYKIHTDHNQTRISQLPQNSRKTNKRMSFSTGVIPVTSVSRPQLKSNLQGDRVLRNSSQGKNQEVEDQCRNIKLSKNKTSVTACNESLNAKTLNVKSVFAMCDKCMLIDKHDMCVLNFVAKPIKRTVASESTRNLETLLGNYISVLVRHVDGGVPLCQILHYLQILLQLVEIVIFIVDSGCSKHMTENPKLLINFVEKFLGTVKFGNDQIAPILGYGDLGNDLLTGSRRTDLYSITLQDTNSPNPICLMAKATSSQAWLWHRRLTHLNFDTINLLSKNDIVVGPLKLKFVKDHLCSSCELGKAKRKLVQRGLQAQVRVVRTDKGTKFLNQNLHAYCAAERILHQTSIARTPEQNGVVERRNRTLVEAARTMLSAAKVPLFFLAEAIVTACFTQNRSLVIPRHEKTPYHIINDRKPSVKFFHIFGSVCYIVRDGENIDKIKEKGDECIFVGYSTQSRAYTVFNKRTRVIKESIHVNFDELPHMASDQLNSDPASECQTMALNHDSLSPAIQRQANVPQAD
nr:integrase, catalytic region, zinc finger, CCHC-type, peptidase aspartic, catalytic [Tanacetum cinerariifolium]